MRLAALALILIVAMGLAPPGFTEPLKPAVEKAVRAATFEVVVAKNKESETVEYARPLPWDSVPYSVRNDPYLSIGTAFAVGKNEFLTAAHVLGSWIGSSYQEPRLRAADGAVYTIDRVLKFSGHEDFVLFSILDPPAVKPLRLNTAPAMNSEIHAVGNALGEGVVIRSGLLTSETPEQQNGRWRWYRFSAATSPGNSGGPLVDSSGRVVGLVVAASPAENLNFALPVSRAVEAPEGRALLDSRMPYQLPVMPFSVAETVKFDIELPLSLAEFGGRVAAETNGQVDRLRAKLLKDNAEQVFPRGDAAQRMMLDSRPEWQPQLILYGDDGEWGPYSTNNETSTPLPQGGEVIAGFIAGAALIQVDMPENVDLASLLADSRRQMDFTLKALNWTRPIGNEPIRVTSLGAAVQDERHVDEYGRTWQLRNWRLEATDIGVVALILPVPDGFVALMRMGPTAAGHRLTEELKVLSNLLYLSYVGTVSQWEDFLALTDLLPKNFGDLRIESESGKRFRFSSPRFDLDLDMGLVDITDRSTVELEFAYFPEDGFVVWDVSAFRYFENPDEAFNVFASRRPRVPTEIGGDMHRTWTRMLQRESPFDGKPYMDGKNPSIQTVFGLPVSSAARAATEPERLYEVGISADRHYSRAMLVEMQQQLLAGFKLRD